MMELCNSIQSAYSWILPTTLFESLIKAFYLHTHPFRQQCGQVCYKKNPIAFNLNRFHSIFLMFGPISTKRGALAKNSPFYPIIWRSKFLQKCRVYTMILWLIWFIIY